MSVRERTLKVVADSFGLDLDEVSEDMTLIEDLGGTSIDFFQLQFSLEKEFKEFKVEITGEQAENFKAVKDIIAFLEMATASPPA